jgi:hypothetical protein
MPAPHGNALLNGDNGTSKGHADPARMLGK